MLKFHRRSSIPSGCTGLAQPLNTIVNKQFKGIRRDFPDQYIAEQEAANPSLVIKRCTLSDKWIMLEMYGTGSIKTEGV